MAEERALEAFVPHARPDSAVVGRERRTVIILHHAARAVLNICDLSFFNSLATAVHKLRRGRRSFDIEQLVDDVYEALNAYPSEKLERMWQKKSAILKKIIAAKGGNKYDLHGDQ